MRRTDSKLTWYSPTCLITLLSVLLVCSCTKEEYKKPEIAGYYQMVSLVADTKVDLNNDGRPSTNMMEEISPYHFDSPRFYMEIRPTQYNDTRWQYVYPLFPHSHLTLEPESSPSGGLLYETSFLNGYGYEYTYDTKSKIIYLDRTDVKEEDEEEWGKLHDIKVVEEDKLQLMVTKKYYNLSTAKWVKLQLTAMYTRVKI